MVGRKIVFIIPGFGHQPTSKGYKNVANVLRQEGYHPIPIRIPWKRSTISENTTYLLKKYHALITKNPEDKNHIYLLGFSFGALIALIAATQISVKGLILCSLSPFFKEDLSPSVPKNMSLLQEKRYADFSTFHFAKLTKKIKTKKLVMLYGEKEAKPLIKRVTAAFKKIPSQKKYLFSIDATQHNIADKKYISTVSYAIKNFL